MTRSALTKHERDFASRALTDLEVTGYPVAKLQDVDAETVSDATSSRFSDGTHKPKLGEGVTGWGSRLHTRTNGKTKPFDDGNGLCSPGQWPLERRRSQQSGVAQDIRTDLLKVLGAYIDFIGVYYQLAARRFTESPLSGSCVNDGRVALIRSFQSSTMRPREPDVQDR